jgi:hypothetical protein
VCRPKEKGGLGIIDLDKFARALQLRWWWLHIYALFGIRNMCK